MATTTSAPVTTSIAAVTLEVADLEAARRFYSAFGVDRYLRLRASQEHSTGFRGFTLALTVSGPATVDGFIGAAVDAGATVLKPAAKSLWGYSGVLQAPDGTIWKIATSAKKDTGPDTREIDEVVLLIGVEAVRATKQFYVDRGMSVTKSVGSMYVEFAPGQSHPVKMALYRRRALAKEVGVPADGTGSHRIVLGSTADAFTDLDGFVWEAAAPTPS